MKEAARILQGILDGTMVEVSDALHERRERFDRVMHDFDFHVTQALTKKNKMPDAWAFGPGDHDLVWEGETWVHEAGHPLNDIYVWHRYYACLLHNLDYTWQVIDGNPVLHVKVASPEFIEECESSDPPTK